MTRYRIFGEDVDSANVSIDGTNLSADIPLKDADGNPRDVTLAIIGLAGGGTPELQFRALDEDLTPTPSGKADIRFVHASPDSTLSQDPGIDLYVNESGTGNNEFTLDPVIFESEIPFGAATDYFRLPAGDYRVDVTDANTTSRALPVTDGTLDSRDIVTTFVIGDGNNQALDLFSLVN